MRHLTFASLQVRDLETSGNFYTPKPGFEISEADPQACVFRHNKGQAGFAIRTPLEDIDGKALGTGVSLWFAVNENVDKLGEHFITNGITAATPIMETPFEKAFHIKDPDGFKLTFLETK